MPNNAVRPAGDELVLLPEGELKGEEAAEGVVAPQSDKGTEAGEERAADEEWREGKTVCEGAYEVLGGEQEGEDKD